jgi:hypothetical protein
MKIGILLCGFECDELIDQVLTPWLEVKNKNIDDQFIFSCVYGQFKEYADFFGKKKRLFCFRKKKKHLCKSKFEKCNGKHPILKKSKFEQIKFWKINVEKSMF